MRRVKGAPAGSPTKNPNSGHGFAFPRRNMPELRLEIPFPGGKGPGKSERPAGTRSPCAEKVRTGWFTGETGIPVFPARMVLTVSFALSPGDTSSIAPVATGRDGNGHTPIRNFGNSEYFDNTNSSAHCAPAIAQHMHATAKRIGSDAPRPDLIIARGNEAPSQTDSSHRHPVTSRTILPPRNGSA